MRAAIVGGIIAIISLAAYGIVQAGWWPRGAGAAGAQVGRPCRRLVAAVPCRCLQTRWPRIGRCLRPTSPANSASPQSKRLPIRLAADRDERQSRRGSGRGDRQSGHRSRAVALQQRRAPRPRAVAPVAAPVAAPAAIVPAAAPAVRPIIAPVAAPAAPAAPPRNRSSWPSSRRPRSRRPSGRPDRLPPRSRLPRRLPRWPRLPGRRRTGRGSAAAGHQAADHRLRQSQRHGRLPGGRDRHHRRPRLRLAALQDPRLPARPRGGAHLRRRPLAQHHPGGPQGARRPMPAGDLLHDRQARHLLSRKFSSRSSPPATPSAATPGRMRTCRRRRPTRPRKRSRRE